MKEFETLEEELKDALQAERDKKKRDNEVAGGEFREYEIVPREKKDGKK